MRIAIFVYQTTLIHISTCESDLQLCGMNADTVSLSEGENTLTIATGIYKIISSQDVLVSGDSSSFDVIISTSHKENDPTPPPSRATVSFASIDPSALHAFFAVPEAKALMSP